MCFSRMNVESDRSTRVFRRQYKVDNVGNVNAKSFPSKKFLLQKKLQVGLELTIYGTEYNALPTEPLTEANGS